MTSPVWRDEHGKRLIEYPRPSLAVDVAVLSLAPGAEELGVLLHRRSPKEKYGDWSLPGTFIHEGETLNVAALRALSQKAGIEGLEPKQLRVFDDPKRDFRGWVLTVAHVDVVPYSRLATSLEGRDDVVLAPVSAPLGELPYDHEQIIDFAAEELRRTYEKAPDPAGLLEQREFTLLELRRVHEAVQGKPLQKDNFRRAMAPQLREVDQAAKGRIGRPAQLYRKPAQRQPRWADA